MHESHEDLGLGLVDASIAALAEEVRSRELLPETCGTSLRSAYVVDDNSISWSSPNVPIAKLSARGTL